MWETASPGRAWSRIGPSLLVLAVVLAATALAVVPTYRLGKAYEDGRTFLQNYRSPNDHEVVIQVQMDYVRGSSEANDVLFVGDSSCYAGIRPGQFERMTGLRSYNLGLPGLIELKGFNLALRTYLEHHPKPRVVVACFHPWTLDKPSYAPDIRDRFLWCYGPGTEDTRPPHVNAFRDQVRQGVWILLGEATGGLRRRLDETIHGQIRDGDTYRTREKLIKEHRGFFEFPPESMTGLDLPRGRPDEPFAVSAAYRAGFRDMARICEDNGIALLIRLTPVFAGEAPRDFDGLRAWAAELKAECPGVIFGRPEVLLFDRPFLWDKRHCNPKGAERLTAVLAGEVMDAIAVAGDPARSTSSRLASDLRVRRGPTGPTDGPRGGTDAAWPRADGPSTNGPSLTGRGDRAMRVPARAGRAPGRDEPSSAGGSGEEGGHIACPSSLDGGRGATGLAGTATTNACRPEGRREPSAEAERSSDPRGGR